MLLLDSQAVLWVLDDSPRLGKRARDLIATATRVHVSAVTVWVWELTIKSTLGKLSVPVRRLGHPGLTPFPALIMIGAEKPVLLEIDNLTNVCRPAASPYCRSSSWRRGARQASPLPTGP